MKQETEAHNKQIGTHPAVVAAAATAVQTYEPAPMSSWGAEGVASGDIIIPKALLQQPLSKFAVAGVTKAGDICDSMTGEILGGKDRPMEMVPLMLNKTWVVEKQDGSRWNYVRTEQVTPENVSKDPFECWGEEIEGKKYTLRRNLNMNYYMLLRSTLDQADAFPYVVSFRRTSMKSGRTVGTHFTKMAMGGKPPAARSLKLSCHAETNDDGTFFVWDVATGTDTTPQELAKAYVWYSRLKVESHKVDESDMAPEAEMPEVKAAPGDKVKF